MMKQTSEPVVIHSVAEMRAYTAETKARGQKIGLVPTMGALHEGHLSLIRRAVTENDITIVSVFVNPIQFDDPKDFAAYPKTLESDAKAAFGAGANVVFAPCASDMYPEGFSTFIDMTGPSEQLCGAFRPSHFRGVLTVLGKLFGLCRPDAAYLGEKDAQQLAVVRKMATELCMNVIITGCPTVREKDGLAMSSRNVRLAADERLASRCIFRALHEAAALFASGETSADKLVAAMLCVLGMEPLARVDYAKVVDPFTFLETPVARKDDIVALAVYIGETRLIDNLRLR